MLMLISHNTDLTASRWRKNEKEVANLQKKHLKHTLSLMTTTDLRCYLQTVSYTHLYVTFSFISMLTSTETHDVHSL